MLETLHKEIMIDKRAYARNILDNLASSGLLEDYFLYEGDEETRIACNCLASILVFKDNICMVQDGVTTYSEPSYDPLKQVENLLAKLTTAWTAYGYVTFDLAKFYHPYTSMFEGPLLQFVVPRFEVRITTNMLSFVGSSDEIKKVKDLIHPQDSSAYFAEKTTTQYLVETTSTPNLEDQLEYCQKVETLTQAIREGALTKAILSRCVQIPGVLDLVGTYEAGSLANNAHRSFCFKFGEVGGVGFSPEIFLVSHGQGHITSGLLAATRSRSNDPDEDQRLENELLTDAKEIKEHALSVLSLQNDVCSFCSPETVRIYDFMKIKKFRCVQHLSSYISGRLSNGFTFWDAFKVLFPAVTVTGIPRSEALRWISNMEVEPRRIYAGAVGWIDSQGKADFSLAIRSAFQYGNSVHLNAGAGIVEESVPEWEYKESVKKMKTMQSQIVVSGKREGREGVVILWEPGPEMGHDFAF